MNDNYTNKIDKHLSYVSYHTKYLENVFKTICHSRKNLIRQKQQGYKNLESQRHKAKKYTERLINR